MVIQMSTPISAVDKGIGLSIIGLSLFIGLGGIYWLWLSIRAGSVAMFALGILPPGLFVTALVGAWSLLFGPPEWLSAHLPAVAPS